ncbi:hypothetical protein MATL_G00062640 [Megalops atlanticus]|uniref:Synaptic plasticity regulator PANTS n=1 Tax=Megalops atlanticus TaxID=7932 RepID=A0A9D3T9H3_MEGAT|nr:hypothetical protein MATL_G00062640 [Megalops atlanticus]
MADREALWRPPRSCDDYWSEFRLCKSLWNRFHHYYTFGKTPTCQQWKDDYYTCREWEKSHSTETKESLQQSERARVAEQRKFSPVWELRTKPPEDWHLPLPQDKRQDS